jgi:hypothetical protein
MHRFIEAERNIMGGTLMNGDLKSLLGPQRRPFICQRQSFVLSVTGDTLGMPLDDGRK